MTIQVTKEPINLREKLNELETNKGLKGNEILQAETAQEVRSLIGAGRKNLIINGGFDVWQRGTSFTSLNGYGADRWKCWVSNVSKAQELLPNGDTANVLVSTGDATNIHHITQAIENGVNNLSGKTVTVSCYAKASVGFTANFARLRGYTTGGGTTHTTGSAAVTTSWTKFSFTYTFGNITADALSNYMMLYIFADIPNNINVSVAQVQLELGSVATDFEHRSYGEELALCQRYYQKHISGDLYTGFGYTHKDRIYGYRYIKPMRIPPTLSYSALGHFSIRNVNNTVIGTPTAITHSRPGSQFTNLQFTHASIVSTSAYHIVANGTSNAWIAFDAEL